MMRVAILDDDAAVLASIGTLLGDAGFSCFTFGSGRQLVRALHRESFELFLLDWHLPDLPGLSVIEWIRNKIGGQPPILMMTSRTSDDDIVRGLRAGADDFVAKPFKPAILRARIEALARRSVASLGDRTETYGVFEFELTSRTLRANGAALRLTPKEFSLALLLFRNLNRAVTRSYVFETLWGIAPDLPTRTLDIHISKIRTKLNLKENGYRLTPVYGYGYRLDEGLV